MGRVVDIWGVLVVGRVGDGVCGREGEQVDWVKVVPLPCPIHQCMPCGNAQAHAAAVQAPDRGPIPSFSSFGGACIFRLRHQTT